MQTQVLLCSCNGTVPIDAARVGAALDAAGVAPVQVEAAHELCRRECTRATAAMASGDDLLIGCTQEAPLFSEMAAAKRTVAPIRFVNVREQAGWSDERERTPPKIAALVAAAASAAAEPVTSVSYRSAGRMLVIGAARDALAWAERLSERLAVSVLITEADGTALPAARAYPVLSGELVALSGWLGAFEASWQPRNPIDLEACVRCNACVEVCPTGAIGADFQIDLARCDGHRACVRACGSIHAIDFARAEAARSERFDLVFDLRAQPAFDHHQPPQGYFHPGADESARMTLALRAAALVGEFEKPKYFHYEARLCAHGRNGIEGCRNCIDVCSTQAIRPDGDRVAVEPHLCMGCGACATVCPSGAMSFQYPTPPVMGRRLRDALAAYAAAGGRDAALLFHGSTAGAALVASLGRGAGSAVRRAPAVRGLPARVVPFELHHVASLGIDLMLSAVAFGASQVIAVLAGDEAPQYREALAEQMRLAQSLVSALGYGGEHFVLIEAHDAAALERATRAVAPAEGVARAARFALAPEKRRTVEFALDHLLEQSPQAARAAGLVAPLPQGAPFGTLQVNAEACTLCLACVGSCPESALLDNADSPQLRLIERNCVQCGLCASTCPEDAITLVPRYRFDAAARQPVVLNEARPFECISCHKPFGTRRMIETMLGRLSAHPMFGGQGLRRLQMCADCRVVDMATNASETTVFDLTGRG